MHVLVIPSWYPTDFAPHNGTFFREQSLAMKRHGHQVGIVALDGVSVHPTAQWPRLRASFRVIEDEGMMVVQDSCIMPFPKIPGANTEWLARRWETLYRRYAADHGTPDLLHAHSLLPGGLAAARVKERYGVPFVVTEHRPSIIDRARAAAERRQVARILENSGANISCSRPFADELTVGLPPAHAPWRYIPGLLAKQFEAAQLDDKPADPFVFGHVSFPDDNKRVHVIIDAFARAFTHDLGVELRIVGDSPAVPELRKQAVERGVAERVRFAGFVDRDAIAQEFAAFNGFVLASESEAFATVIWEALAMGVPVISTCNMGGINALEGHPEIGELVEIDDVDGMARAMVRMRHEYSEYDPHVIRTFAVERAGQRAFAEQYTEAYEQAIAAE